MVCSLRMTYQLDRQYHVFLLSTYSNNAYIVLFTSEMAHPIFQYYGALGNQLASMNREEIL